MKYFGTDGIRGEAYKSLPVLRAFQLGGAIRKIFPNDNVIIGYDTRESSYDFLQALISGLNTNNLVIAGIVTTPMIAYYSNIKSTVGVMITASHNNYLDNGLKVIYKGKKISKKQIIAIEKEMLQIKTYKKRSIKYKISNEVTNEYIKYVNYNNFSHKFTDYVVDTANGAASNIAKEIFLGKIYFDQPNGKNINKNCGCTNIETINNINDKKSVSFSFDGDGDRMLMTINRKIIQGDQILYLLIKDSLMKGKKNRVVCSIMTNPAIIEALKELNVDVVESKVGDSYLLEYINNNKANIGAEPSGHYLIEYKDNIYLGDGLLTARKMIDIISRNGLKKIMSWLDEIVMTPMKTINIRESKALLKNIEVKSCIKKLLEKKEENDKIIIRPSGTENLIRITVSMKNKNLLIKTIDNIKECITGV